MYIPMMVGTEACTGACDCVSVGRAVRVGEWKVEYECEGERGDVEDDLATATEVGVTVYVWS